MNKRALLFVVALPVAYMALWLVSLVVTVSSAKEITLEVEGYDPRDLLSGHYLTYRVSYGEAVSKAGDYARSSSECICFGAEPTVPAKATWIGGCDERDQNTCGIYLRGHTDWGSRFTADIERYYFPEQYASALQRVPPNATIRVAVPSTGRGIVRGMYVDGIEILEWAKHNSN
jgi:uncharacterized membrane-anchored protein